MTFSAASDFLTYHRFPYYLRFHIELDPMFNWSGRYHGGAEGFWVWIEDNNNDRIYHNEYVLFMPRNLQAHTMEVIVPVYEPMPQQYFIRVVSDSWVGWEELIPVSFRLFSSKG